MIIVFIVKNNNKKNSAVNMHTQNTKTFRGEFILDIFTGQHLNFSYWFLYNKVHNNGHRRTIF